MQRQKKYQISSLRSAQEDRGCCRIWWQTLCGPEIPLILFCKSPIFQSTNIFVCVMTFRCFSNECGKIRVTCMFFQIRYRVFLSIRTLYIFKWSKLLMRYVCEQLLRPIGVDLSVRDMRHAADIDGEILTKMKTALFQFLVRIIFANKSGAPR